MRDSQGEERDLQEMLLTMNNAATLNINAGLHFARPRWPFYGSGKGKRKFGMSRHGSSWGPVGKTPMPAGISRSSGMGAVWGWGCASSLARPTAVGGAMCGSMNGTRVPLLPAPSSPSTRSIFLLLVLQRQKEHLKQPN